MGVARKRISRNPKPGTNGRRMHEGKTSRPRWLLADMYAPIAKRVFVRSACALAVLAGPHSCGSGISERSLQGTVRTRRQRGHRRRSDLTTFERQISLTFPKKNQLFVVWL